MTLTLDHFYILVGLLLGAVAVMNLLDRGNPRRVTTALFWGLYALLYLAGERMPPAAVGALMIGMALVAGVGWVRGGKPSMPDEETRRASAAKLGNRLFLPALLLPIVTVIGATLLKDVQLQGLPLLDQKHLTLVSLGCASVVAVAA